MLLGGRIRTKRDYDHILASLNPRIANAIRSVDDRCRNAIALRCARIAIEALHDSHVFGTGGSVEELKRFLTLIEARDRQVVPQLVELRLAALNVGLGYHLTLMRVVATTTQFTRNLAYWHAVRALQATLLFDSMESAARVVGEAIASTGNEGAIAAEVFETCQDRLLFF